MIRSASGEYRTAWPTTAFMILALVASRSSRLMPGLRGIPEVMMTISESLLGS